MKVNRKEQTSLSQYYEPQIKWGMERNVTITI